MDEMHTTSDNNPFELNFEWDHTGRVANICDDDMSEVRVSRAQYAKMGAWAREQVAGLAYHLDGMIAEARW